jgi:putative transcriptional regulator
MGTKANGKSIILDAVYATAAELHRRGHMDKQTMREFDVLCLEPVSEFSAEKIRALRDALNLSQAVFAAVLNTSVSTVRKWEIGDKRPSAPSMKLLSLLEQKGLEALL